MFFVCLFVLSLDFVLLLLCLSLFIFFFSFVGLKVGDKKNFCGHSFSHFRGVFLSVLLLHIEDNVLNKFGGVELLIIDICYLFFLGIFYVKIFAKLILGAYLANP